MKQVICDRCREVIPILQNKYWVKLQFGRGKSYALHFCKTCGKIKEKEIIEFLGLEGHEIIYV